MVFQSTHSRGVRREQWASDVADLQDFNPRTHEECDDRPALEKLIRDVFQSTHSRGVRLADHCLRRIAVIISIHALTRSATEQHFALDHNWSISIHALTRSATKSVRFVVTSTSISIHALTRSATRLLSLPVYGYGNFNPRTHEECDGL